MKPTISLGGWPLGINNVDSIRGDAFQPALSSDAPKPALRDAVNVDLDRSGNYRRRDGTTLKLSLTGGHSGYTAGDLFFVVDDGDLVQWDTTTNVTTLITANVGNDPISYTQVGNRVYWSNITSHGSVDAGVVSFWGLPNPNLPALSVTTGALRAGRYLVAVTYLRGDVESGCNGVVDITLTETGGIAVTLDDILATVNAVNVYCSDTDGTDLYWVAEVAVGLPIAITSVSVSLDLLDCVGLYPPPLGHLIFHYNGRMFVCDDTGFYWSQPLEHHRFQLGMDYQATASKPIMAAPLEGGFYLALANGETLWVKGDDPEVWQPTVVDNVPALSGAALIMPARKLPWLQVAADALVAVWVSLDGLVIGLPDGNVKHPTDGRVAVEPHTDAATTYRENKGMRQIISALWNRTGDNSLGVGDRVVATVIKAGTYPE